MASFQEYHSDCPVNGGENLSKNRNRNCSKNCTRSWKNCPNKNYAFCLASRRRWCSWLRKNLNLVTFSSRLSNNLVINECMKSMGLSER